MVELRSVRPDKCEVCRTGPAQVCQRRWKQEMRLDRWLCWQCWDAEVKAKEGNADGAARG
jgi:hypothetical protein